MTAGEAPRTVRSGDHTNHPRTEIPTMRARTGAYTALAVVAWLFAACVLVQVFLAGLGVFATRLFSKRR